MKWRSLLIVVASVVFLFTIAAGVREGGRQLRERKEQRDEGLRQLNAAREEMVTSLRRSVEEGAGSEDPAAQLKSYNEQLGRATEHLNETDRKPVVAGQHVLAQLTPLLQTYARELKALQTEGFVAPASLVHRDSIKTRSELVTRFDQANDALLTFYREVENAYLAELKKMGVSGRAQTQAFEGFKHGANIQLNLTIREADATLAQLMQKTLTLLDKSWGRWRAEESGQILFEEESALAEFSSLQTQLQEVTERQRKAQTQLLDAAAKLRVLPQTP